MSKKIALKKLKSSDLSFFKSYLQNNPKAKQKGFNLDTKVVGEIFFPSLKDLLEPLVKKATHVDLAIFGPGSAPAHNLARKIKIDAKNLRLNGELVHDPIDQPNRYDILVPGDFAVIEFIGTAKPTAVKIVLIAAGHSEDSSVHAQLHSVLPNPGDSMIVLPEEQLEEIVGVAAPSVDHQIRQWLDKILLEELGSGDTAAAETLNRRTRGRGISPSDFKASKDAAERIGHLGEELLDQHLQSPGAVAGLSSHEWVAQTNAISPFDFLLNYEDGSIRHADAKSTSGRFLNPIYLSAAEIHHAINSDVPYDIFRLYDVKDTSAKLRVSRDIKPKLVPVQAALEAVPDGVRVDSVSFNPSFFEFDGEVLVEHLDEDEETV